MSTDPQGQPEMRVEVADKDLRFGAVEKLLWDETGELVERACRVVPTELLGYSIVLSRIAREMRRTRGILGAQQVFQGFVDTMQEASKHDR